MPAGRFDLFVEQGSTYRAQITVRTGEPKVAVDLTGYSAKMQFRLVAAPTSPVLLTLQSGDAPPLTGLILGGTAGTIDIYINAADTDPITSKAAVYDLEITAPNGDVIRVLKGSVTLDAEVTR